MSQYDFGVIDPNTVDGTQLADMLNKWRDALYTMQRGPSVPTFVVPGQMWLDDSRGLTEWRGMYYVSVTLGSAHIFSANMQTGIFTFTNSGGITGQEVIDALGYTPANQAGDRFGPGLVHVVEPTAAAYDDSVPTTRWVKDHLSTKIPLVPVGGSGAVQYDDGAGKLGGTPNVRLDPTRTGLEIAVDAQVGGKCGNILNNTFLNSAAGYHVLQIGVTTSIYYEDASGKIYFNVGAQNESLGLTAEGFFVHSGIVPWSSQANFSVYSDANLKSNITDLDSAAAAARIFALHPRAFTLNATATAAATATWGFIAGEFETVYPDMVHTRTEEKRKYEGVPPEISPGVFEDNPVISETTAQGIGLDLAFYADVVATMQRMNDRLTKCEAALTAAGIALP